MQHGTLDPTFQSWQPDSSARERINRTISQAWRPSTAERYALAVSQFTEYCAAEAIPLSYCLPASEALLCAFASSLAGRNAGGTIRNKCSALRGWHIQNNVPWFGGIQLSYVVKGAENMRPPDSRRAERPAVTSEMLDILSSSLDLSKSFDACVFFVATSSFWGQIRLGEILPTRESGFVASNFPRWEDLKVPNANGSRLLHLPHTKTGGTVGENVIITRQLQADPIEALLHHQFINGSASNEHIASYWSNQHARVALTKRKFLKRVNDILIHNAYDKISGHCFRIGGTTHFLLAGVPPDIVKLMGRWSSDAFLRYWRSLEIIAPLHAELLRPVLHS
ncbi:hypothetical protein D9615_003232 [Tricholomella constricta]|uniref:Tyr recombinase domain-containing protein n=1 Tax=Tricholomella constricta TaxID=117010 RepID=A0A8H5HIV3_9AGAR|nr:hypothetical protein D9615_003246 [Tricholomella constricta]KAF5384316.1 hypothetical protein D9615_003232 [Tricholomella constricta]